MTALDALRRGDPVLVYDADDREGEVDVIYAAEYVEPVDVARLRNDAGGLICTAIADADAEALGLPFMTDVLGDAAIADHDDLGYDERSSFSLWVNHRSTYTGVTDNDRATTIGALADAADAVEDGGDYPFADEFRSPGHVAVLRAHPELLAGRRGHTEMGVALADAAGLTPAATVCEMLDGDTGDALAPSDARAYAEDHGLPFLTGADVEDVVARTARA